MGAAHAAAVADQAAGLRRLVSVRTPSSVIVSAASPCAGHSAVAADLALALAGGGTEVLLLEARDGSHGAASLLGADTAPELLEVVRAGRAPREASLRRGEGLRVVQAQRALALAMGCSEHEAQQLREALAQLCAQAGVVLVDATPGMTAALPQVDRLLVVTRDDPGAVIRTYGWLKRIAGDLARCPVSVAITGVRSPAHADRIFGNLAATAAQFLGLRLECIGQIPDDEQLRRAADLRRPLMEVSPASPAALALRRCADALLRGPASIGGAPLRFPMQRLEALRTSAANN